MSSLNIIPLGGMGSVTQNMFLYQYQEEILIIDCGIGFPDLQMPGADILIPDTRYLRALLEQGNEIVGMVLTHGHDDHIGATPYILPELPDFPIYASELTAGFAENRMAESKIQPPITVVDDGEWYKVGSYFEIMAVPVTHSVPDTRQYFIKTPEGLIYHGSDFKLDKNPVDGKLTDEKLITEIAQEEVLCMMVDCLRVEKPNWVPSESTVGPVLEEAILNTKGKVLVTLMSSHLHRIQQTADAALKDNRKIVFIGRSVEQNVEVGLRLGKLKIPRDKIIDKRDKEQFPDRELCIIIAGSQGQEGSSLVRAIYGSHPVLQIKPSDKVIFSADAIPGNEVPYYQAIDELARNGVDVVYPSIEPNIHQSGHASAEEQAHLVQLVKPKYLMPIGGADRHRALFLQDVAKDTGYSEEMVLLPKDGVVIEFENRVARKGAHFQITPRIVDGLGIGDVGPMVLSDRKSLGGAGIVVVLIPSYDKRLDLKNIKVISRGFVFMKEADEVIKFIKDGVAQSVSDIKEKVSLDQVKSKVEKKLAKQLFKTIRREPLIVVEFIER